MGSLDATRRPLSVWPVVEAVRVLNILGARRSSSNSLGGAPGTTASTATSFMAACPRGRRVSTRQSLSPRPRAGCCARRCHGMTKTCARCARRSRRRTVRSSRCPRSQSSNTMGRPRATRWAIGPSREEGSKDLDAPTVYSRCIFPRRA